MEHGSAGLPRLWPAHAVLAEDGLYVLEQYHITQSMLFGRQEGHRACKKTVGMLTLVI